tara:strand:+ start:474 stop:998 length:525 start_codon:yes stop_codon:yes gene_type:complete
MSGSLILIQETIVSSAVSSVTLTGIDSTYDVYKVVFDNVFASADDDMQIRVTTSGTADSDSEYDNASEDFKTSGSFGNTTATNQTKWDFSAGIGTSGQNSHSGVMYLFNFDNSSEFSFITMSNITTRQDTSDELFGFQGGGMHTVAEANDGISYHMASGNNIAGGTFKLYGLVK